MGSSPWCGVETITAEADSLILEPIVDEVCWVTASIAAYCHSGSAVVLGASKLALYRRIEVGNGRSKVFSYALFWPDTGYRLPTWLASSASSEASSYASSSSIRFTSCMGMQWLRRNCLSLPSMHHSVAALMAGPAIPGLRNVVAAKRDPALFLWAGAPNSPPSR